MSTIRTILVGLLIVVFVGYVCWCKSQHTPTVVIVTVPDPNYVMTVSESQESLKRQGFYKGKIDGKWGPETDRAYCDWCDW